MVGGRDLGGGGGGGERRDRGRGRFQHRRLRLLGGENRKEKRSGEGRDRGREEKGRHRRRLFGGIEDLLLSSSLLVRRYSQSAFVGSIFWFSLCASIPLFENVFWRMPVLCLWFNFLIFFLGSRM